MRGGYDMWNYQILGNEIYYIVQWFIIYSILGWAIESAYMSVCSRKLTNRGFVRGPFCPIYGAGAITVYFLLSPLEGNYILLYACGAIIATAIEYLTARIMIRLFGEVWWDYNEKPFNYKGILCLESSIAWGVYTLVLFLFLQGAVEKIATAYPKGAGILFARAAVIYYLVDFILCAKNVIFADTEERSESCEVDG